MKKYIQSIGYVAFLLVSILALITAITTYKNPFSLYENPLVWILIVMLLLVILVKEYFNFSIDKMREELQMEKDGITPTEVDIWAGVKKFYKRWTKTTAIEEEGEIVLDHNYDGIKELDNVLPPWWVYLFYASIVFAGIYFVRFEVLNGDDQETEYKKEIAQAKLDLAAYKKMNPDVFDISKAQLLTDNGSVTKGKAVFKANCAACHMADGGGGIGPNLTDKHWILGGGFENVFKTIYNGGRDGKGMIAWGKTLKPEKIEQVASYIMTLEGTTPAKPKEPQGDIWVGSSETESKQE